MRMKKATTKLQHGSYSRTPKGFAKNMEHMEQEGYSKKRAVGTAYGEANNGKMSYDQLHKMIKNL